MLTSIIDTSYKVPGSFVQVSLGAGPRSPATGAMRVLLVGNKSAAGTGVAATLYEVAGPDDVKTLAGVGSELHRMAIAFFNVFKTGRLFIVIVATAGTAASQAIAFTGTATADGAVEVWISGERVVVPITTGDTHTAVAVNVAAAINAKPVLPCTATAATGTATATARCTGPRGNCISVRTAITGAAGISHTPISGYFTSGATMDDPQAALDAVASQRFHLTVAPYWTATELAKFRSFHNTGALPINGKRGRFVACSPDTLATAITLSDTVNAARGEIAWCEDPDSTPGEIAAGLAGALAAARSSDRAANMDGVVIPKLKPQAAIDDIATSSEQNSALNNGLTPIVTRGGELVIVRSITNYHLDASSNDDFSILDSHKVDVADFVGDVIEQNFATRYKGFKLAPHPAPPAIVPPKVATPVTVRTFLFDQLKAQENVLLVNVDALAPQLVVELDGSVDGRLNADIPIDVIEHFHQLAANVAQIG